MVKADELLDVISAKKAVKVMTKTGAVVIVSWTAQLTHVRNWVSVRK